VVGESRLCKGGDDDDDLERLLDQARACERQHDADGFNEVRAKVKIYVLKGNVPQLDVPSFASPVQGSMIDITGLGCSPYGG
jgi:hypothetical protein